MKISCPRRPTRHSAPRYWQPFRYNDPVKPSIFVVEDDPDISRLVRHHLENEGFAVRVYPTGSNVLADAERQRPALFVLDIMVPEKTVSKSAAPSARLLASPPVPVIFLTAKSSEADRVLGLELGADDYIAKPFSPRELVARVKAVLRRFERPLAAQPDESRRDRNRSLGHDPHGSRATGSHHGHGVSPARLLCPP